MMMDLVDALPRRAWRRLSKIEALSLPMGKIKERVEGLLFKVDARTRTQLENDYRNLATIDDYFEFANRIFGPHQLRPEITGFLAMARQEQPRAVCEIGMANGGTTFLLGQALPSTEIMIGMDLFVRRRPRLLHFARPGQRIALLDGDSSSLPTIDKVREILGGRSLDLVFIDGDHSLEGVYRDFCAYRPFVRDGGLIAFHDIVEDSFTRTGVRTEHWTGGVPRLWRELKGRYRSQEFVSSSEQDGLGIGVIRYDPTVEPPALSRIP
jgi:predicted O-methyltransferase YrrM